MPRPRAVVSAITALLLAACLATRTAKAAATPNLSASIADFSHRLYAQVVKGDNSSDAVFSPYSLHAALAMTSLGARGATWAQLSLALATDGFGPLGPHQAYHDTILKLNSALDVSVLTANGVFLNPRYRIRSDYVAKVKTEYLAQAADLDMAAPEGPEAKVNAWVDNRTYHIITDLLPKHSLTPDTGLVLVNSVYFNGSWETKFMKYATHQRDFTMLGGQMKQVPMMSAEMSVFHKTDANLNADVLQLNFKGGRFNFVIVLPHVSDGIIDLERNLASGGHTSVFNGLTRKYMRVQIPKFKLTSSIGMKQSLKALGVQAAFDPNAADFSGLADELGAYVSSVSHKAVLEVQEEGVTAAAATQVTIAIKNLVMGPPPQEFKADHPFAFYLRDSLTGALLFQGRYSGQA